MAKLYPRQRELVKLLIGGLIIKEAAAKMGISRATGNRYMATARQRLSCRTTEQMMFQLGQEACRS